MSLLIVLYILTIFFLVLALLLLFLIIKGVGLKLAITVFKVRLFERKGWGMIRKVFPTGDEDLVPFNFRTVDEGAFYEPFGKDKGKYILKSEYMARNYFGIPTIAYRSGDPEPINPKKWIPTAMSSVGLDTMFAKHARSQQIKDPLAEFIIKNFKLIALGVAILLAGLLFLILNQNDTIATLTLQATKTVVVDTTTLGA